MPAMRSAWTVGHKRLGRKSLFDGYWSGCYWARCSTGLDAGRTVRVSRLDEL